MTTLPPSCADCLEIWEPQLPGTLRACPDLCRECFTFTSAIHCFFVMLVHNDKNNHVLSVLLLYWKVSDTYDETACTAEMCGCSLHVVASAWPDTSEQTMITYGIVLRRCKLTSVVVTVCQFMAQDWAKCCIIHNPGRKFPKPIWHLSRRKIVLLLEIEFLYINVDLKLDFSV